MWRCMFDGSHATFPLSTFPHWWHVREPSLSATGGRVSATGVCVLNLDVAGG
jgi:hypothetical protein